MKATCTGEPCDLPPGTVGRIVDRAAAVATGDGWLRVERVRFEDRYADAAEVLEVGSVLQDGDNN